MIFEEEIDSLLIEFTMRHGGQTVDLLATGGTPQAWNFREGLPFEFEVIIEDAVGTENFYVISAHNDEVKSMALTFDIGRGVWLADGFFDPSNMWYVPGQLSVNAFNDVSDIFQNISVDFSEETTFDEIADYLTPEWRNATSTILEYTPDRIVTHIVLADEDQTEMEMTVETLDEEIVTTDEQLRADGFVPSMDDNGNLIYTRIIGDIFSDEGATLEIITIESVEMQGRSFILLGAAVKIGLKAFGASKAVAPAISTGAKIASNAIGVFDVTQRAVRGIRAGEDPRTTAANVIAGAVANSLPGAGKFSGLWTPILVGGAEFLVSKAVDTGLKHYLTRAFSHGTATNGGVVAIATPSTLTGSLRLSPHQTLIISSTLNLNGQTMSTGNLYVTSNINLEGGTLNVSGDVIHTNGTINLGGGTLNVAGDVIQTGGTMNINGGRLNVSGDYIIAMVFVETDGSVTYTPSNGILQMTNLSDYVYVGGDFITRSSNDHVGLGAHQNRLTAGILEIKGDLIQLSGALGGHTQNFGTRGTHRVIFSGTGQQSIYFSSSASGFNHVEFRNPNVILNSPRLRGFTLTNDIILTLGTNTLDINGTLNLNGRTLTINGAEPFTQSGTINIADGTLNINESLTQNGNILLGGGALNIEGSLTQNSTINLGGGTMNVSGNLNQTAGWMEINGGQLNISGDYIIAVIFVETDGSTTYTPSNGVLLMTSINDYVYVGGDFITRSSNDHVGLGAHQNRLTAGILEVKGDFIQLSGALGGHANNFGTRGTHRVIFNGAGQQTIYFSNSASGFTQVEFRNSNVIWGSSAMRAFTLTNDINLTLGTNRLDINGTLNLNGRTLTVNVAEPLTISGIINLTGGTLNINESLTQNGNLLLGGGTLNIEGNLTQNASTNLNGGTLNVTGDLIQTSGWMEINGGRLNVGGDYIIAVVFVETDGSMTYTSSNGVLLMTNINDYVYVGGDFITRSSNDHVGLGAHQNRLTAGVLEIKGDLIQLSGALGGHANNFGTRGTHRVIFSGTGQQRIYFSNSASGFTQVEFRNPNIRLDSSHIRGFTLINNMSLTLGTSTLNINGTIDLNGRTLTINSPMNQTGGTININGGRLNVGGNYEISAGILQMTRAADYVYVGGDFITRSSSSHTNQLTAGTMEVRGDFTQIVGNNTNFNATGTHRVIFSGAWRQNVSFENNQSRFNNVSITNSIGTVAFQTRTDITSTLAQPGGAGVINRENVFLRNRLAFEDHGASLNAVINRYVGNAVNVIPTFLDYERYLNRPDEGEYYYEFRNVRLRTTAGGLLAAPTIGQDFVVEVEIFEAYQWVENVSFIVAIFTDSGVQLHNSHSSENFVFNTTNTRSVTIPGQSQRVGRIALFIWDGNMRPLAEQYVRNF